MPVDVGERQLRTGVRALAPTDQPGCGGPGPEVNVRGQLGDPGALALPAVLVERGLPRLLVEGQDRFADRFADRVAQREANLRLAARIGEVVTRAGAVGAGEDLAIKYRRGERLQRELKHIDVI